MLFDVFKNKTILVTGHTGFKGSWLTLWLEQLGAKVVGYSVDIPTNPALFEVLKSSERFTDHREDILNLEKLNKVFEECQPDIVFHLAAKPIVRECYQNPRSAFETNLMGTVNILECLRTSKSVKAAILITTDKCYENVEWEYGYRENDRLGGIDPYSASKGCAEIAISSYIRSYFSKSDCKIVSVRAGNVIGGGDWAQDRIFPDAMRSWSQNNELIIRNPYATRPWQHVLEPLSGYLTVAAHLLNGTENVNGEAFNFGPEADVIQPVSELVEEMRKLWSNQKYKILIDPNAKREANFLKLCCDKSIGRLRWRAILNFKETVEMTSSWYKNYYSSSADMKKFTLDQIKFYQDKANELGIDWAKTK